MADGPTLTLGTAEVKIKADLGELDRGFDKAQVAAQKFERAMANPTSIVSKHFNKMAFDAGAAAREAARAAEATRLAQEKASSAYDKATAAINRQGTAMTSLIRRYTSGAGVFMLARQAVSMIIRTNEDAAKSYQNLNSKLEDLANTAAPLVIAFFDEGAKRIETTNKELKILIGLWDRLTSMFKGGVSIPMGVPPLQPGYDKSASMGSDKNWRPSPGGFPTSGLTDLSEIAAAEKKAADERQRGYDAEAESIHTLSVARQKMYDDWSDSEEKRQAEFKKGLLDGIRAQAEAGVKLDVAFEEAEERKLESALEYLEKLGEESKDAAAKRVEDEIETYQRGFDEIADYWEDVTHQMDAIGKDFFSEFVATGIADFESMADKMISTWTSTLFDMAKTGNLFGSGSLFGGSGAGLGGILNNVGALVSKWLPVVGAVVGIAQKIFQKKPSDNRSVATFMPGMTDFGFGAQSAHESSDNTLSGVSQAAEAIQKDISALKAAGIEFTQELLNIWLGERDESTFQLSGGGRVSTGSVGDARDLALDALNALLGTATSADPKIAAILKSGGGIEDIQKYLVEAQLAKDFALSITDALLEITDPLEYALTIWERTARANLAMAEQTGFSLDKVREYNAALYQQMIAQQNAGAISAVSGLIGQLQHGDLSAASPGAKFDAGLSEFNKLRDAALSGGAKEAEAFAQFSSGFLPQARDYLGTSVAYGNLQSSTLSTLQSLMTSLTAPQTMPDLTIPLQAGFSMTVGAVEQLTNEVKGLRADNQNLSLQIAAMARTVPA